MKNLYFAFAIAFMCSSAVVAQTQQPAMPQKAIERIQAQMTERYSKMDAKQLERRKASVEKRLTEEQNERIKQRLQVELDTINSLIQK